MRPLLLVPILVCLFIVGVSFADSPDPPFTYKQASADGKFVFVMIPPVSLDTELKRSKGVNEEIVKGIRAVHAKSGLYKNDGSTKPLWAVDWYRFSVEVASDGIHVVRYGDWPFLEEFAKDKDSRSVTKDDLKQEAISIIANGKMIRYFSIAEFVDEPKLLPMSVSHFRWLKRETYRRQDAIRSYHIRRKSNRDRPGFCKDCREKENAVNTYGQALEIDVLDADCQRILIEALQAQNKEAELAALKKLLED